MKLCLYRECGPRSFYYVFFEVQNAETALELLTALTKEELRVHFSPYDYKEKVGETVGGTTHLGPVCGSVAEVVKALKPKGR